MRAVVLRSYGGPEVLGIETLPDLEPGRGEVRVAVAATALNRADVLQRLGKYPPPPPRPAHEIPGLECAGVVDRVGPEVTAWKAGDRVCGLLAGGGYAEQVVAHERMLLAVPAGMELHEATAVPEVWFTAWDALCDKGGFRSGDAVLIHAGASGVGTAAIQLARHFGARRVLATTRSADKAARLAAFGCDRAIVTGAEDFAAVAVAETGGRGADVVLDFVGAPYLAGNLRAAATDARIVVISMLGGARGEIDLRDVLVKRLRVVGTTLRSRPLEQKMMLTQRFDREVLPHFRRGGMWPVVDREFSFDRIADAHRWMEENRNVGKIVVRVRGA